MLYKEEELFLAQILLLISTLAKFLELRVIYQAGPHLRQVPVQGAN
jgi:hypothetical protein